MKNKFLALLIIFAFLARFVTPLFAQEKPAEAEAKAGALEVEVSKTEAVEAETEAVADDRSQAIEARREAKVALKGVADKKEVKAAPKVVTYKKEAKAAPKVVTNKAVMPGNVTMDFKDADISNVLRILSYKGGVNIVAGPEVTGLVTIRLADVPWDKALDVVLRTYGFAYEREGNIIRVTTTEKLKEEELTTEVYSLSYADAEEVSEAIAEMLTAERGKAKYDVRTNVVIVTDIPTNLYKIGLIIAKLDKRTPQVLIEAKIIETRLDDSERLGIDWTTTITARGAAKPSTFPFSRRVQTTWEDHIDRWFPVGYTQAPAAGAQFSGTTQPEFPAGEIREHSIWPFVEADAFTFGTLDFTQFQAVLEFLEARTDTDILSNPRITTLNNKESVILVGSQMLFPSFNFNEETGDFVIAGFEDEKDLGVKLAVTPHINEKGDIVLKLKPEIKSFTGIQTLDATRGIVAPIFSTREAEAEVMIRDGDTIMLGGLITKTTTKEKNKIPFLGEIPLIGDAFFTKTEDDIDRIELIIFITVHLIKDKWDTHLDPSTSLVHIPVPRDKETYEAIPRIAEMEEKKKKKKWFQLQRM